MRHTHTWPGLLAALTAVALTAAGCGSAPSAHDTANDSSAAQAPAIGSARHLTSLATTGQHASYIPLTSPRDALAKSDLVVHGTLTDIMDGISLRQPAGANAPHVPYATVVIAVDRVISGDPRAVHGGRVYILQPRSAVVSVDRLAAANSRPKAVAVLTDVTGWRPDPRVQVIRPAKVPAGAPLFAAYADGLWLQAAVDTSMHAFGTDHEDLTAAWGGASTVAQFTTALERAARRS